VEIKPVGEIPHATNVTSHYTKKPVKESQMIVNVMELMRIHGNKKNPRQINTMGINQIKN